MNSYLEKMRRDRKRKEEDENLGIAIILFAIFAGGFFLGRFVEAIAQGSIL